MSSVTTSRIVESTAGVSTSNSIKSSLVVYPERKLSTVHSQVLVIGIAIPLSVVVAFATMIIYQSLNVVTGLCCNGTKGKQEVPAGSASSNIHQLVNSFSFACGLYPNR